MSEALEEKEDDEGGGEGEKVEEEEEEEELTEIDDEYGTLLRPYKMSSSFLIGILESPALAPATVCPVEGM